MIECRDDLVSELKLDPNSLEISMGMSHDFEQAVSLKFKIFFYFINKFYVWKKKLD